MSDRVDCVVGSRLVMRESALTSGELKAIEEAATIANPARERAIARGVLPFLAPSATLSTLRRDAGAVSLPRGLSRALRRVLGNRLRWVDTRIAPPLASELRVGVELRDVQTNALGAALRHEQGLLLLPTGAGKTVLALAIAARTCTPTLIVVGAVDLARQWAAEARAKLGIDPGIIGGGSRTNGDVTIATWQSLAQDEALLADLAARTGCFIVDEAHLGGDQLRAVIDAFPARYRFGLTGTLQRSDELEDLVCQHLGAPIFQVTYGDVADHLLVPRLVAVTSAFSYPYQGPDDWPALLDALVRNEARNRQIVDLVQRECCGGAVGLLLSGRIAHVETLAGMLRERGVRGAAITGNASKAHRSAALDAARAGDIDVLVASTIADAGLDLPRLSRLFLTFPARGEARLLQRIGRVLRPHPEKRDAIVFDFVDERVGVLRHQAKRRAETFARTWPASGRLEVA